MSSPKITFKIWDEKKKRWLTDDMFLSHDGKIWQRLSGRHLTERIGLKIVWFVDGKETEGGWVKKQIANDISDNDDTLSHPTAKERLDDEGFDVHEKE